MNRRHFLAAAIAASLARTVRGADQRPPKILLRSAWQTINIGDIGHTPGILRLLAEHMPEAEVRLWPRAINEAVEKMLRARFPKLQIVQSDSEVARAFDECDFLLHGSGPALVGRKDFARWRAATGKPYGVYAITFGTDDADAIDVLSGAQFVFFRETVSLEYAKKHGVTCPVMAFAPDAAFACDVRDDAKADAYLKAHGLEPNKFLCCIPRLRYTPRWLVRKDAPFIEEHHVRNQEMKESDHVPLREAIIALTRGTDFKVLVCPEDATHMAIGKEMLIERLPQDVLQRVVWREDFWLTDEALSVYLRSAGMFGFEMHSPIMCIGNGVPALVGRWDEQTSKGFMWRDIGLDDWLFDMDRPEDVARLVPTVLSLAQDPAAARKKTATAQEFVAQRQRETMQTVSETIRQVAAR